MAQRTMVQVTSDLSGDENAETSTFSLAGTHWEIDLTQDETEEFHKVLAPYIEVARKAGSTGGTRRRSSGGTSSTPKASASGVDNSAVRAWAKEQNMEVSERGRISGKIIDAYKAANGGS